MSLEIVLFLFVRKLREANFELLVDFIKAVIPWKFATENVHYPRWLSVYLEDLQNLQDCAHTLCKQFFIGHFPVKETTCNFSNTAIDRAQKQNSKFFKIDGEAVGILESPRILLN